LNFLKAFLAPGLYHKEETGHFSRKIKCCSVFFPIPPDSPNNKTVVLNQGSRCLYVFIYSDIYSVFVKQLASLGAFQKFSKHTWQSHKDQRPMSYELFAACWASP
jgi:hypothetical protein